MGDDCCVMQACSLWLVFCNRRFCFYSALHTNSILKQKLVLELSYQADADRCRLMVPESICLLGFPTVRPASHLA